MRKDTATTPTNTKHWEVGLDLKPLWEKDEPYNFVVRYFFKEKWALRGGLGFELSESKDTFRIFSSKLTTGAGLDTLYSRYGLNEIQTDKNLSIQAFVGIQYEWSGKKLSLYNALDLFFTNYSRHYALPISDVHQQPSLAPAVISDFARVSVVDNTTIGGGIRLITGMRYYLSSNFSVSAEMALTAQGLKYENVLLIRDESLFDDRTLKQTTTKGRSYAVKIEPLFRVFINYHFFKN